MSNELQNYLRYYQTLKQPEYAVLVIGEWGCGKTYQVKQCIPESDAYYISLFGIDSVDAMHNAVLAEMAPLLTKAQKHLPGIAKGIGVIFGASSLANMAPGICAAVLRAKVKPDKTVIFDDLERCSLDIGDLCGVINKFVEHHKCRVVIIAHDEKIYGCFGDMKEKLIGQTIEATPNVLEAYTAFCSRYDCGELGQLYSTHRADILRIFEESGTHSLRMLRHLIEDLRRLYRCLSSDQKDHKAVIGEIVRLHSAMNLEHRMGNLQEKDLRERSNKRTNYIVRAALRSREPVEEPPIVQANEKYSIVDLESNVLNDEVLIQTVVQGIYSEQEVQQSVNNSAYFLEPEREDTPAWKIIMNLDEVEDSVLNSALHQMRKEFEERSIRKPGEMLHVFALMMMLSEKQVNATSIEEVRRSCESYIDDLLRMGELKPLELRTEGVRGLENDYAGFSYWVLVDYEAEFDGLKQYLANARAKARDQELANAAAEMLEMLGTDGSKFSNEISYSGGSSGRYAADAFLHNIDPEEFVEAWLKNPPAKWRQVKYALENRYIPGSKLVNEYGWVQRVIEILEERAEESGGIRSLRIKRIIPNLRVMADDAEEQVT